MKLVLPDRRQVRIRAAAFSLVETMIGFAITGIVLVSLFAGFSVGFAIIKSSRENARATQVLLEKMEQLRLTTFDDLANCKLVQINWVCSRTIIGAKLNTESVQSAKVVIRNR